MSEAALREALAAAAAELAAFAAARDWEQFHTPKNLAMSLAIEAGEVMEHFQWTAAAPELDEAARKAVALELADVFSYLLRLASVLEIDLAAAAGAGSGHLCHAAGVGRRHAAGGGGEHDARPHRHRRSWTRLHRRSRSARTRVGGRPTS